MKSNVVEPKAATPSDEIVRIRLMKGIGWAACFALAAVLACAEPDEPWSVPVDCPGRGAVPGVPFDQSRSCLGERTIVACGRFFSATTDDIGYAKHLPSDTCYQFPSGTLSRDLHEAPGWSDCSAGERMLAAVADYCPQLQFNLSSSHVRLSVDDQISARIEFGLDEAAVGDLEPPLVVRFSQRSIDDPEQKLGRLSERRVAIDEAGIGHTDFTCSQPGSALIEARLASGGRVMELGLRELVVAVDCDTQATSGAELCSGAPNCAAPTHECQLVAVVAPEHVAPGEQAELVVDTEFCPIGTPISLEVLSSSVYVQPPFGEPRSVATTDANGRASTSLQFGLEPGFMVLAVRFPFYSGGPDRLLLVEVAEAAVGPAGNTP